MTPDRDRSAQASLALSCARDGTIVQILRDDLGFALSAGPGARLPDIVDSGSAGKAETLIASLGERECVVGWQLNVPSGDAARPLYFAGAASDESLLILAAPSSDSVAHLFDDIVTANVATSNALRTLLHEKRSGITASIGRDNQLYEELSRLNNELINRERELARKTAALERLTAEKSRIVAIAAHDLRNPLTIISAYADLLKLDGALQEEHVLYADEIGRSARFMMELVEEMFESSIEGGRIELVLQDLDLVQVARHSATVNRMRADRKEIAIAFEQEVERAPIRADPVKLRQILNNLVVNAIKFSPSRTRITVRVRRADDWALVEIEDQGIGIPPDQLAAIFEPFKTLGLSGTAGEKSTGLGLAIVKQLAELHGAIVHVESEIDRGSLFRVGFPASD